jgi:hypothetical protein
MTRRLHPGWVVYLVVYFALLAGAGVSLWEAGVLSRLPLHWVASVTAIAIAFGVLLGAISRR